MTLPERFRSNIAAGLFFTLVYHEWHTPERLGQLLLWALVFVTVSTITGALLSAAQERGQQPKRPKQSNGPA